MSPSPSAPRPAREARLTSLARELSAALTGLLRSPLYSLPALASLALGIGAATAVFAIFSALVLRPLPFPREAELVRPGLFGMGPSGTGTSDTLSPAFAADFGAMTSVFQSLAVHQSNAGRLTGTDPVRRIALELVSPNFFDTLQVPALLGRTFTASGPAPDGPDVVVLRHGYWLEAFGGAPVVGEQVLVDDHPKLVLGIVADEQALPSYADMWTPTQFPSTQPRFFFSLRGLGRLAPGLSLEAARERLRELSAASQIRGPLNGLPITGTLASLRDDLLTPQQDALTLMLAAVAVFLLLACSNVAALLATRASVRRREHALRAALGATRAALLRHSALEAVVLALTGGALGLGLALLGMRLANHEYHDALASVPVRLDGPATLAFLALLLVATLTATLAPALHARGLEPMDALRSDGRSSQSRSERRWREALVAIQVAASLALLIHTGLLVRTVSALLAADLGFSPHGVVAAAVLAPLDAGNAGPEFRIGGRPPAGAQEQELVRARSAQALALVQAIRERLQQLPQVETVCVASEVPFDWFGGRIMMEPEASAGRGPQAAMPHDISPSCLATLRIPLLAGRDFTARDGLDGDAAPVALVNQAFARSVLGVENAVGQRFRVARPPDFPGPRAPWFEVVGMVGDTREARVNEAPPPAFYRPFFANALAISNPTSVNLAVAVRTGSADVEPLIRALPSTIVEVAPRAPVFIVESLSDRVEQSFSDRTALERLLAAFSLCAVALAAIGLFGVTAYSVAERASELAIRRALGASRADIAWMIVRETGQVALAGIAGGVLLCWLGLGLLDAFLYGVGAADPLIYACVCLGILCVAVAAALLAARSAGQISPARALLSR